MRERSASATIRGYCYQFDKTILEVLEPKDGYVTVEQIEDLGRVSMSGTDAIQCKYIPSTKFSDSAIREAIIAMLANYVIRTADAGPIRYHLYAHFSDPDQTVPHLSVDDLKRILTWVSKGKDTVYHEEHNISDATLAAFLGCLNIEIGPEYEVQKEQVVTGLRNVLNCSNDEAGTLYYNNALRVIVDVATKQDAERRRINLSEFLRQINTKALLFNRWYAELLGQTKYLSDIKNRIRRTQALLPQREKTILIDRKYVEEDQSGGVAATLIESLADAFYPLRRASYMTKPPTVVLATTADFLRRVKQELLHRGSVDFNDGFESVAFTPRVFIAPPVINRTKVGNRAGDKVERASYRLRLISEDTLRLHGSDITPPDTAIVFSDADPAAYFDTTRTLVLAVAASSYEDIYDVLGASWNRK